MHRPAGYSDSEDEYDKWRSDDDDFNTASSNTLIENEEDSLESKLSKLTICVLKGQIENVTSFIIEDAIDVNVELQGGWKPVSLAASTGDSDMLEYLINNGADINTQREMMNLLMLVCNCPQTTTSEERLVKAAELLISKGVDVNAINKKRINALMYAASNGYLMLVKLLLPLCNKDANDNQGWTVLFWAVNDNRLEVVKYLLENGLNPDKRDIRANKPMYYAKLTQNYELMDLLPQEETKNFVAFVENESYDFQEIFNELAPNEMPDFEFDVTKMLYGMKCPNLVNTFEENYVNLMQFLTLDEEALINLNIKLPYQRQRIMAGLFKIHKYPWKTKSLPPVNNLSPFATIDLFNAMGTAVRQFIVLEASLIYLEKNISARLISENKQFKVALKQLHQQCLMLRQTGRSLNVYTSKLDKNFNKADLITADSRKKLHRRFTFRSILHMTFVCCVGIILYKNRSTVVNVVKPLTATCLKMIKK